MAVIVTIVEGLLFIALPLYIGNLLTRRWISSRKRKEAPGEPPPQAENRYKSYINSLSAHNLQYLKSGLETFLKKGSGSLNTHEENQVLNFWREGCGWEDLSVKVVQDFIENFPSYRFSQECSHSLVASKKLGEDQNVYIYFYRAGEDFFGHQLHTRKGVTYRLVQKNHFLLIIASDWHSEPTFTQVLYSPYHNIPQVLYGRMLANALETSTSQDGPPTAESSEESLESIL